MQALHRTTPIWVAVILAASATAARGQGTTTPPAPASPDSAHLQADIGAVNTSGNTSVTTVNASDAFTIWRGANTFGQTFGVVYGTLSDRVQTNLWTAGVRDQYSFTKVIGLFALVGFDRNSFAGIDRRFEEGAGVAITAIHAPRDQLEIDLGVSYIEQRSTTALEDDHASGRGSFDYRHTFGKNEYFEQTLEGIPDFKQSSDYRINSQSSLVAPLSKHFAVKVGYAVRYANLPPPGFKTTDRLFTTDLQVGF